jgi:hypothetical protein
MRKLAIFALILLAIAGLCLRFWPAVTGASGPLEAVVVEDAAHRTPQVGAILCSAQILTLIKEKQIAWRAVDPTDSGPDMTEVQWAIDAAEAKKVRLPALVLRQGGGNPKVLPLPDTPAQTAAVLAAAAGP